MGEAYHLYYGVTAYFRYADLSLMLDCRAPFLSIGLAMIRC
jgi:hypothetical protein